MELGALYFARRASWSWLNEKQIVIHDTHSSRAPRMITLEPWHQMVFLAAIGQFTVDQLVVKLAEGFEKGPPPRFRSHVIGVLQELLDEELIRLSDTAISLPPELADAHRPPP